MAWRRGKQKLQNNLANLIAQNPDRTTQETSRVTTSVVVPPSISAVETITSLPSNTPSSSTSSSSYTQPITYLRSRNISFDATSLRPLTRFYPFFAGINISAYIIPKLLEIEMISGTFLTGEDVVSDATFTSNSIRFRLCNPDHKSNAYKKELIPIEEYLAPELLRNPLLISTLPASFFESYQQNNKNYRTTTDIFTKNPYNGQPIPTDYTSSSSFLNVDVRSLQLPSETKYYGSVAIGMRLIGRTSGAEARISNLRLISDDNGRLLGSFYIPDPNKIGNPKFTTGSNTFTLIDVENIRSSSDSTSSAEAVYVGSGTLTKITNNTVINTNSTSGSNTNTNQISGTNIVTTRVETIIPAYTINTTSVVNTSTTTTTEIGITFKQDKKLTTRLNNLINERDKLEKITNRTNKQNNRLTFVKNEIIILEEVFEETTTKLTPKQIRKKTKRLNNLRIRKGNLTINKSLSQDEQEELDNIQDKIDFLVRVLQESGVLNP